jgi:hypothetical protein
VVRRAAKRDDSERAIIDVLESLGARVQPLSGPNLPDLLVLTRGGNLQLIEVKTGKAKLKPGQVAFAKLWPVLILRTPEEAASWLLHLAPDQARQAQKSNPHPIIWDEV